MSVTRQAVLASLEDLQADVQGSGALAVAVAAFDSTIRAGYEALEALETEEE